MRRDRRASVLPSLIRGLEDGRALHADYSRPHDGGAAVTLDRGPFLAALVLSSDDAIIGKTLGGCVTDWNAAAEVLYGYTAVEMLGQPIARLVPPERADELPEIMNRLRRGERIAPFETVRVRKDGLHMQVLVAISPVVDPRGHMLGAATITRDISAAKQLTALLQALADISGTLNQAHPHPETVLDSIVKYVAQVLGDGAVFRIQGDAGLVLVAAHHRNPMAQSMLLKTSQKTLTDGQGAEGRVHASSTPLRIPQVLSKDGRPSAALGDELWEYRDTVGLASLLVVPARVGDRSIGTFMVLRDTPGRPYTDVDQAFVQTLAERVAVAIDNARLFAAERQARAVAEQAVRLLEQSVGLRDQVLLTVSHDMRNPLTVILGQAQLLDRSVKRGGLDPNPLRQGLARIMEAGREVTRDMEELVDASRQQAGEPLVLLLSSLDLVALVTRAVATWRVSAPVHRFEFSPGPLELVGMWDRARLSRVLDNLFNNAVKFSPSGGTVSVRLWSAPGNGEQVAVLQIQDHGIGIPAADLPYIFQWFRRGMNVAHIGGTGIGLASAAAVVSQHGGTLLVESEQSRGTTFTLRLPLASVAPAA